MVDNTLMVRTKNTQSGFVTMIILMLIILVAVIGFAFVRVMAVNK